MMIMLFIYNLTRASSTLLLVTVLLAGTLSLVVGVPNQETAATRATATGKGIEAAQSEAARVRAVFDEGLLFTTYAHFETFFDQELPRFHKQQVTLRRQAQVSDGESDAGPDQTELKTDRESQLDEELLRRPLYVYAVNKLDIEPVRRLYRAHYGPAQEILAALDELSERMEADGQFRQIALPTVRGLVKAITLHELQVMRERLMKTISGSLSDDPAGLSIKKVTLKPHVERIRRELCQLLSYGRYEEGHFDCDNISHLRDFLNMQVNRRETLGKVSHYAVAAYLEPGLDWAGEQGSAVKAPSARLASKQTWQPHRAFGARCQALLEPVFGIFDHALLDFIYGEVDTSAARVRELIAKRLNDRSDDLINYYHEVYHVCKLVNLVNFGGQ